MFANAAQFLTDKENELILNKVREQEKGTSGEIRLFIESKCSFVNPIERAKEIFLNLKMYETEDRNAVLIYIAFKDQDFALFCDSGMNKKTDSSFWKKESSTLAKSFYQKNYVDGMLACIKNVGEEMRKQFPTHGEAKNELPDEIIFGK
jgi:uncharacterized membrane protein